MSKKPKAFVNFKDRVNPVPIGRSICNTCKGHTYCDLETTHCKGCQAYLPNNSKKIWRNPAPDAIDRVKELKMNKKIVINGNKPLITKIHQDPCIKKHSYPCRLWLEERSCVQCRQEAEEREYW